MQHCLSAARFVRIIVVLCICSLLAACSYSEADQEPLERAVITPADFVYLGAFAPPQQAVTTSEGGKWSTAYATGGLALRSVMGEKRFFATTHVYSGGLVYEMSFPGLAREPDYPVADIVREWGDIYQDRKITQDGYALGGGVWTHGLFWDEPLQVLQWSYGHSYNVGQNSNPVLGHTYLLEDGIETSGPWLSAEGSAHSQRVRGGTLRIPQWFAERYTEGKTLGIGFGGYWSGVATASQGPALYASTEPRTAGQTLQTQTLIAYSYGDCAIITPDNVRRCKAIRNSDYVRSVSAPVSWDTEPINDQGYWTAADSIEGAAVWIDSLDRHGLIFFATLGQGEICYCDGGIHAESYSSYWYIYDPKDLAEVAQDKIQPWQPSPSSLTEVTYPAGVRVTGAVFDEQEEILYLYVYGAYTDGGEAYPLVYAYKLKP